MSFKPLADNVQIKVAEAESKTSTGIYIPGDAKEKNYGTVIAVGSGTLVKDGTKFPIEVKEGDTVLFRDNAGVKIEIDGESFLIIREFDILGIL